MAAPLPQFEEGFMGAPRQKHQKNPKTAASQGRAHNLHPECLKTYFNTQPTPGAHIPSKTRRHMLSNIPSTVPERASLHEASRCVIPPWTGRGERGIRIHLNVPNLPELLPRRLPHYSVCRPEIIQVLRM